MDELQLKTNQQVCIPLIPLKEIPSQINTSWVEIVSKVFLCFFFFYFLSRYNAISSPFL